MIGLSNNRSVGNVLHNLGSVGSTNQFALDLIASKNKPTDGTAVFSANQSDGRGQIGSRWISGAGQNIAISFIFYPNFLKIGQQWLLSETAALAMHDFLSKIEGIAPKIKWPNDLYVLDKKMGGILIQNSIGAGGQIDSTVIGIGLNVNQVSWPPDLPNPTSLKAETGRGFELLDLVGILCNCLEIRYLQLGTAPLSLRKDYLQNLYRFGELSDFETADGQFFSGKISGIRPDGRLVISQKTEPETAWDVKQIRFANPSHLL